MGGFLAALLLWSSCLLQPCHGVVYRHARAAEGQEQERQVLHPALWPKMLNPQRKQSPSDGGQVGGEIGSGRGKPGAQIRPQLFLLFMVYKRIYNQAVWERFLQDGIYGYDYQALVHCKEQEQCRQNIHSHYFDIIPTVETRYCLDLVSGMNQLLKYALLRGGTGSPYDKFVFLSDATLPTKPFQTIWAHVTKDSSSDFCVFPRNEWAEVSQGLPGGTPSTVWLAVKHHQWIILSRNHAETSVRRAGQQMDLMQTLQLNLGYTNTGCLDEFWHFAVAFPDVHLTSQTSKMSVKDFNGGPLSTSNYEVQGQCDTFVHWVPRASGIHNNITALAKELSEDAGTDMVVPTETRPGSIRRLSRASLVALRKSNFLFVRKVVDKATFSGCEELAEAFSAVVFADTPTSLPKTAQVWLGDGVWLDNQRSPVAISSMQGASRVVGTAREMQATGYYCKDKLKVTFKSGYEATAVLSQNGAQLVWDNGVIWPRAGHEVAPQLMATAISSFQAA